MVINCSKEQGIGVIEVSNGLTAANVDAFREQLLNWQEAEPEVINYIVDLKRVDFMDSAGLGTLNSCRFRNSIEVCLVDRQPEAAQYHQHGNHKSLGRQFAPCPLP